MRSLTLATAALLIALHVPGSGFQVPGSGSEVLVPVPVSSSARAVVSRADLIYNAPVARSEEGIPIGNGRMGTLVWTTPSALKFQINRVDIQPINKDTRSFFERNTDYMGGAGFVDLELAGSGGDVFTADGTSQRLSVYEGLLDVQAAGVHARMLAWHERDVIAIEIDDRRAVPEPIQINLRMLRSASQYSGGAMEKMIADRIVTVRTRDHIAASQIAARDGRILLTQNFQEGTHRAKSAVAIALLGRKTLTRFANETEVRIVSPAERGRVVVLIASAATLDAGQDVAAAALSNLDAAAAKSFDDLAGDNAEWWHGFWQRGTIALQSADGTADEVAANYHYYLYLMASTSRGAFPPKFNGMLWNTAGDMRPWGTQHWFANLSCYYEALFAANRIDLLDPVFSMYSGMFDAASTAARQQWGSQGIYIPETVWHDGLAALPDDIAAEMRDLYLLRKPWAQRSAKFLEYARTGHPHSSRWNWWGGGRWTNGAWVPTERPTGAVQPGESHSRDDSEGRVSLLAALRVHAGSPVAARSRVPDDQRRGGVLSPLSEPAERGRREVPHPSREQQRERQWRARHRRRSLRDARHFRGGHPRERAAGPGRGTSRPSGRSCSRIWRRCQRARTLTRCAPPTTPVPLCSFAA